MHICSTQSTVEEVQNALDKQGALLTTLQHLPKRCDHVVREALAFLAALMYGGNKQVQQSLVDYFQETREEEIFFVIKNRLDFSKAATKERLVGRNLC